MKDVKIRDSKQLTRANRMSITEKILTILEEVRSTLGSPVEINDQYCFVFSAIVIERMGGATENLYESFSEECFPAHFWITCNGLHYDAECPRGVETPGELPFFHRLRLKRKRSLQDREKV